MQFQPIKELKILGNMIFKIKTLSIYTAAIANI